MRVYERLVVGLRSFAALRLLTQILSWGATIYVVRRLGNDAVGEYAVALVVFNYLAMTFDGTLLETLVQRPTTAETRRPVFSLVVGLGSVLAGLTVGAAGLIGHLVKDPAVPGLVVGVAGAFFLMSLGVLPQATLARQMAFPRLASIAATQSVCVTMVTVTLAARGDGAWSLVFGLVIGMLVRVVLLNASSWSLMWPTLNLGAATQHLRFGGVLFADNLLWRWYTSLDTFLLGRWAGSASLGYYNLAQQVAELPLEKITTVVNDISLPAYAELHKDGGTSSLLLETIRAHATIGFALFWGLATIAPYAIPVLFGASWSAAVFPLIALAIIAPMRLIGSIETPAMTGIGRPGVLVRTKLIIAPCMTVALLVACLQWGIRGAALAWLFVFPLCYGYAFRYVLDAARIPYRQVWAVVRGPVIAALAMVVAVLVLERGMFYLFRSSLVVLITGIVVGIGAYVVALKWVDPEAFQIARGRLSRVIGMGQAA